MRVVGHDDEGVNGHLVKMLGLADDPEEDVGQLWGWLEQQPALHGPGGDFDKGVWWDEPEWSCHTGFSANHVAELLRPESGHGQGAGR
jgi:hypothetical protein